MLTQFNKRLLNQFSKVQSYSFSSKNLYGLQRGSSQLEIKKQYYNLAQKYHPDKNSAPAAKDIFSEISFAYEVLSNEQRRRVYDSLGKDNDQYQQQDHTQSSEQQQQQYNNNEEDIFGRSTQKKNQEEILEEFEKYFSMRTGKYSKRQQKTKGENIEVVLNLSFEDSVNGCNRTINYKVKQVCGGCNGTRSKKGFAGSKCFTCGGSGSINYRDNYEHVTSKCNKCNGIGEVIKHPCKQCKGFGNQINHVQEDVFVPKGVDNGQILKFSGKGSVSPDQGENGDLLVKCIVEEHLYFIRDQEDIHTSRYITVGQAVFGDDIKIKTIYGTTNINLPRGTQDGDIQKIENQGIAKVNSKKNKRGNHFVQFKLRVPTTINEAQKQLFQELIECEKEAQNTYYTTTEDNNNNNKKTQNKSKTFKMKDQIFSEMNL